MVKRKKTLGILLVALLTLMLSIPAVSAGDTLPKDVSICKDLGLYVGGEDGTTAENLSTGTQRMPAAIMFLRLKGLEEAAKSFTGTENFMDVGSLNSTNKAICAYLKAHPDLGWQGYPNGNFGVADKVTAQQYYKVMLEALGYKAGTDFTWADVNTFAASKGLSKVAQVGKFTNADLATAIVEGLEAKVKGSDKSLVEVLVSSGVDRTKFEAAGLVQPPPPPPADTHPQQQQTPVYTQPSSSTTTQPSSSTTTQPSSSTTTQPSSSTSTQPSSTGM